MNIFVYSDESGVFDNINNEYFVYGGLIFLEKEEKDIAVRKYKKAEKTLRENNYKAIKNFELKACKIKNKEKAQLYRSLNQFIQFGIVIDQKKILDRIFKSKKDKQRYLDYAYRIGLKKIFKTLINEGKIISNKVNNVYFFVDEHTTATNGKYELQEALENEFKNGIYNHNYLRYFPPIFENLQSVQVKFCNSSSVTLIRGADIIANRIYYCRNSNNMNLVNKKILFHYLP